MSTKQFRTAALTLTLLAGTTAFAVAQSSSRQQQPSPGATQTQNAPGSNGASNGGAQPQGGNTTGQSPSGGQNGSNATQASPSGSQNGANAPQNAQTNQPSNRSTQSTQQPSTRGAQTGSQPSTRTTQGGAGPNNRGTTAAAPSGGGANLTSQQRTVIKNKIIDNRSAPRVSHVDFNVRVGVAVPTSLHLAPLPPEIVSIHPAWRSYVYFVYEDEVIIVNPGTHKIVEVITVS